jgi:peptidoglycan/xylan/chitin deacetylase (PgdA/CDA1 family)
VAAITFDDAYRSVIQYGHPLLRRRGLRATIFTCSDLVGTAGRYQHDAACPVRDLLDVMDWEEHRRVLDDGWGIGGHTATHARLSECDSARLRYELETPIAALEQRLGVRAPTMSWPFGSRADITAEALKVIAASGYSACFSSYFGENVDAEARFEIRRIDLGGDHPALAWKCWMHGFELKSGRRWLRRLGLGTPDSGS